jgi:hypothetical protein
VHVDDRTHTAPNLLPILKRIPHTRARGIAHDTITLT